MKRHCVLLVIVVVMSATVFPVAGFLPHNAGVAGQAEQKNHDTNGISGPDDIWPMFRHDGGNTGCSPFLAPDSNHLAWKQLITPELGRSTPILYADKLYISTSSYYIDSPKTNNPFDITPPSIPNLLSQLLPAENDSSFGLYCLDAKTGDPLWFRPMYMPNNPALFDDKIYITDIDYYLGDSMLYCLDAATGDVLWQKPVSGMIFSPTIVADGKIILGSLNFTTYLGSVKCYDLSGNLLWNRVLPDNEMIWFSAPAISGGYVYFISSDMYSYYDGKLYCVSAASGQILWTRPVFSFGWYYYTASSAVCADSKVYVFDMDIHSYEGSLKCYDGATGDNLWTCYLGIVLCFSSPTVSADSVYVTAADLYTYNSWLYRIVSSNGSYLWRISLSTTYYLGTGAPICSEDKIFATPGIFIDDATEIYCFDRWDGTALWKYTTDTPIIGSPAVGDGRVYFADYDGNLYMIEDVLKIQDISGGFLGVTAQIQNIGDSSLTGISWEISVVGGSLGLINRTRAGTIQDLATGESSTVRLLPLFGLGRIEIIATATMPQMSTLKKVKQGLLLGPVCIMMS
jgi:outer membrane protein assembly factor BamB